MSLVSKILLIFMFSICAIGNICANDEISFEVVNLDDLNAIGELSSAMEKVSSSVEEIELGEDRSYNLLIQQTSNIESLHSSISSNCYNSSGTESIARNIKVKIDSGESRVEDFCNHAMSFYDDSFDQLSLALSTSDESGVGSCKQNSVSQMNELPLDDFNLINEQLKEKSISDLRENESKMCSKEEQRIKDKCLDDVMCNIASSAMSITGVGHVLTAVRNQSSKFDEFLSESPVNCAINSGADCMSNIMKGVFDNLWANVTGIYDLAVLAAKSAGTAIKNAGQAAIDKFTSWFSDSEDMTSDKLIVASSLPKSTLKKFLDDPSEFIKTIAKEIYESLATAAKSHYGCDKWEGKPYHSNCLEPMSSFGCASCNQKINIICGIAGHAVGEIGMAYLTGGATALVKLSTSAVKSTKVASNIAGAIADIRKAAPFSKEIASLSRAGSNAFKVTSDQSKAILDKLSALSFPGTQVAKLGVDVLAYGPKKYFKAINSAYKLGLSQADELLGVSSVSVLRTGRFQTKGTITREEILENASLNNTDRIQKAAADIGVDKLTAKQEELLLAAHNHGTREVFTYSTEELLKKNRILTSQGGFTQEQADSLLRKGLAGKKKKVIDAQETAPRELSEAHERIAYGNYNKHKSERKEKYLEKIKQAKGKEVPNMEVFFNDKPFGQTLKGLSSGTSKNIQGQKVYKVDKKIPGYKDLKVGDQFYLDNQHKDHLEVFNSNNKVKVVLNLDGSVNVSKTNTAIKEGRTIPK